MKSGTLRCRGVRSSRMVIEYPLLDLQKANPLDFYPFAAFF
jgi:hypothetical protein